MAERYPLENQEIIVIDDNYTGKCAQAYTHAGTQIENIMRRYTGIIKGLVENGAFQGKTAEQLLAFAETADMLLANTARVLGEQKAGYMESYIEEIDAADREIY